MMYYYNGFMPWGFGLIGLIMMVLFWAIVIFIILAIIRAIRGPRHWRDRSSWYRDDSGPERDRSLDILRERYAKGEITKEQFDAMKKDLG